MSGVTDIGIGKAMLVAYAMACFPCSDMRRAEEFADSIVRFGEPVPSYGEIKRAASTWFH